MTTHDTFIIERTYAAAPERVYAAFADPSKKRRWYAESDKHTIEQFEMDFRVGGVERSSYRFSDTTPFPGMELISDGSFHDIVPNQRIVIASNMTIGGRRISATLITFEITPAPEGTKLLLTHQAAFFEGADGPQMRAAGWRKLLDQLQEKELALDACPIH